MVLKEKELKARGICAFCNFSENCVDCSHKYGVELKWSLYALFNWKKCQDWRFYLSPSTRLLERFKDFLSRKMNWFKWL